MSKGLILITPRSLSQEPHPAFELLREAGYTLLMPWPGRQPKEDELLEVLPGCVGYLAGVEKISRKVLEKAGKLRVISRNGVGMDNIDMEAAGNMGIEVLGTPGANSQGVAELAIALIFDAFRSVAWSSSMMKQGAWKRRKGGEIQGKTLGIIGCGQVGRKVVRMALGLGMSVIGYDVYQHPELAGVSGFTFAGLEETVGKADVISLHCPPSGSPVITREIIALMKKGVHIINTARAEVVDEQALLEALKEDHVAGYSTDVFPTEPPVLTDLFLHEGVTLTPHIGGFTEESVGRSTEGAVENLLKILDKE